ncbi:hypothetical protein ACUY2A_11030, partial [Corynebacterium pilbarense]
FRLPTEAGSDSASGSGINTGTSSKVMNKTSYGSLFTTSLTERAFCRFVQKTPLAGSALRTTS